MIMRHPNLNNWYAANKSTEDYYYEFFKLEKNFQSKSSFKISKAFLKNKNYTYQQLTGIIDIKLHQDQVTYYLEYYVILLFSGCCGRWIKEKYQLLQAPKNFYLLVEYHNLLELPKKVIHILNINTWNEQSKQNIIQL